ncbi:signal peptide peptidase SppA [Candidatus Babeliales bacterium]|nr:signal peptide peptidase SppA [Candidatus Babeliales bacterium]
MKVFDFIKTLFYVVLILSLAQPLIRHSKEFFQRNLDPSTQVGYLKISGMITNSSSYVKALQSYFNNPDIKAILLEIESPGGASGSAAAMFNEILIMKKKHPKSIIVLVENVCASAAYWIACAADHIIASPAALIGSIGTSLPYQFNLKDLLTEYHIKYETTSTEKHKSATDPFVDTTPEQQAMFQKICDQTYEEFTNDVARQRNKVSIKDVATWADGKVFSGREALALGLIDEIGSQSNVIAWLREAIPTDGKITWVKQDAKSRLVRWFENDSPSDTENL